MKCPNPDCAKLIPGRSIYCAYCGQRLHTAQVPPTSNRKLLIILAGLAILAAVGYFSFNYVSEMVEAEKNSEKYLLALRNGDPLEHPFPNRTRDPQWSYTYSNQERCTLEDAGLAGDHLNARVTPLGMISGSADHLFADIQGEQVLVRLWGIDAPDPGQPGAEEAVLKISSLTSRNAELDMLAMGIQANAIIALVQLHGMDKTLNAIMLESGMAYRAEQGFSYAEADRYSNAYNCLIEKESSARHSDRGLWLRHGIGGGERPWEYRQRVGTP